MGCGDGGGFAGFKDDTHEDGLEDNVVNRPN